MDNDDFLKRVENSFADELNSGSLRFASHTYDPAAFGNATVTLHAADFDIKLLRDRSEEFAKIAHRGSPDRWDLLQLAVQAVAGQPDITDYHPAAQLLDVQSAAALFRMHRDAITSAYRTQWPVVKQSLERLTAELERKREAWRKSPEGKRWFAELIALAEEARKNPSADLARRMETLAYRR